MGESRDIAHNAYLAKTSSLMSAGCGLRDSRWQENRLEWRA